MDLGKRKTPDLSTKRFFWLRSQIPIQIAKPVRENSLQFSECNCFGAFVEIVGQHHLVIIQENGVDKRINRIGGIILCEAFQGGFRQDAVCAGRNHLCGGNDADVALLERHLIAGIDSLRSSKKDIRNDLAIIQHAIADAKLIDDIAFFTRCYAHFLSDILHVDL